MVRRRGGLFLSLSIVVGQKGRSSQTQISEKRWEGGYGVWPDRRRKAEKKRVRGPSVGEIDECFDLC